MRKVGLIMALIRCPECEKEISSTAKICPNCGYKIKNKKNSSIFKKLVILIVAIIIIVIMVSMVSVIISKKQLTEEEQIIKNVTELIKDDLLSPNSLECLKCYYYETENDDTGNKEISIVYFYGTAKNKGGGISELEYVATVKNGEIEDILSRKEYEDKGYSKTDIILGQLNDEDSGREWIYYIFVDLDEGSLTTREWIEVDADIINRKIL
jgi:hypothetical protein